MFLYPYGNFLFVPLFLTKIHHVPLFSQLTCSLVPPQRFTMFPCFPKLTCSPTKISSCSLVSPSLLYMFPCSPTKISPCSLVFPAYMSPCSPHKYSPCPCYLVSPSLLYMFPCPPQIFHHVPLFSQLTCPLVPPTNIHHVPLFPQA